MIDKRKLANWDQTMDWYIHLLADPDLMPVRLEENVPTAVGITLLHQMKDDIHTMRHEMMKVLGLLMKMKYLDPMEDLVKKQLRALEKVELQKYYDYLEKEGKLESKGEDKSKS